jgi:hypothetical protein
MTDDVTSEEQPTRMPGVIAALGELGSGAVITEQGLCALFDRHGTSVKRAVDRGELPPPIRLFGQNSWTAGVLIRHLESRLQDAAEQAERDAHDVASKMIELSP